MLARTVVAMLVAACALLDAPLATAQVLRELDPVQLEYAILWGEPPAPVGTMTISFAPTDTPRGRRLEVKSRAEYTIPRDPPMEYSEEATLLCDGEGVARFDTVARALGDERRNMAIRVGPDYQVTTTFQGKRRSYTITSGVQRTNFGLFAGAFLAQPLDQGDFFADFPLLYPVGGDHEARQKFREATIPVQLGSAPGPGIPAIVTRIEKLNKTSDRIWNAAAGHQILLRMEESSNLGLLIYELVHVNGEPAEQSGLLR